MQPIVTAVSIEATAPPVSSVIPPTNSRVPEPLMRQFNQLGPSAETPIGSWRFVKVLISVEVIATRHFPSDQRLEHHPLFCSFSDFD